MNKYDRDYFAINAAGGGTFGKTTARLNESQKADDNVHGREHRTRSPQGPNHQL